MDCGDNIIIVNAGKVRLTGRKREDKLYHHHTGYPGGLKTRTAARILGGKKPEEVVIKAVQRMIPKGPLGRRQMANLKVYPGPDHPHEAQQPEAPRYRRDESEEREEHAPWLTSRRP